jgi:ATP-dependent DNA ligase
MALQVEPPLAPMLCRLQRELPRDGYLYEPKWDGFRCLAFRDGDDVELRSRHDRPLGRYFPEIAEELRRLEEERFVLDGELVVRTESGADFDALMARLHPADSRVVRLSRETPAALVAFDLLALGDSSLLARPFAERRRLLCELLRDATPPLYLNQTTRDARTAEAWLDAEATAGIDGVVAKRPELRYQPDARAMVKVKRERTADCVVAGFRFLLDRPLPAALLLGLYDEHGSLRHVGVASQFSERKRVELLEEIAPHSVPLAGHPWEHGFLTEGGHVGRLAGAAGSWRPEEMELDWVPLAPRLVAEVAYDHFDAGRLRYPARFLRWRPDRDPDSCTFSQL